MKSVETKHGQIEYEFVGNNPTRWVACYKVRLTTMLDGGEWHTVAISRYYTPVLVLYNEYVNPAWTLDAGKAIARAEGIAPCR